MIEEFLTSRIKNARLEIMNDALIVKKLIGKIVVICINFYGT